MTAPRLWWERFDRELGILPRSAVFDIGPTGAACFVPAGGVGDPPVMPSSSSGGMSGWPVASDYLAGELYATALSMIDGSYYQTAKDDMIEYCGGGSIFEGGMDGGAGGEGGE